MTGYALNQHLLRPPGKIDFCELAQNWREDTISVTLKGMGRFADSPRRCGRIDSPLILGFRLFSLSDS
jgi:hypothetical protein